MVRACIATLDNPAGRRYACEAGPTAGGLIRGPKLPYRASALDVCPGSRGRHTAIQSAHWDQETLAYSYQARIAQLVQGRKGLDRGAIPRGDRGQRFAVNDHVSPDATRRRRGRLRRRRWRLCPDACR